jgi:hypothetical protein
MSGSQAIGKAGAAAAAALGRVRQAAAHVKPYASGAQVVAGRGVHRARAVAAPQVERAGQVLEDTVAPKAAAMLSSAARRLEPVKPRHRRWRKLAGVSLLTAVASAVAAYFRNRAKPDLTDPADADSDNAAPAAKIRDDKAGTSTDAGVDGQVRTS